MLLFNNSFLREELRFRGGTALNKLHFPKPLRYSEDIDLARTKLGPSKPIWDHVHDLLDPWLGKPEYFRSAVAPALRYTVAAEDGSSAIRVKVEINEIEITPRDPPKALSLQSVKSVVLRHRGYSDVFYGRGLGHENPRAPSAQQGTRPGRSRTCDRDLPKARRTKNRRYVRRVHEGKADPALGSREADVRKAGAPGFLADVRPLLAAEERAKFDEAAGKRAFSQVFNGFIVKVPGKAWATTPELLKKHGLTEEKSA